MTLDEEGDIVVIKLVFVVILFFISAIGGFLPTRIPAFKENAGKVSITNCFCAGLFLSITFLHLIPDAYY